jgi:hypothetical protein
VVRPFTLGPREAIRPPLLSVVSGMKIVRSPDARVPDKA